MLTVAVQQGIAHAREVFPSLAQVPSDAISICVNGIVAGNRQLIRISPMSWPDVLPSLARYEVLDILVDSSAIAMGAPIDPDSLPNYEEIKARTDSAGKLLSGSSSSASSPSYIKNAPLAQLRAASRTSGSSSQSNLAKSLFGKRTN